jgi:hypothetical protein
VQSSMYGEKGRAGCVIAALSKEIRSEIKTPSCSMGRAKNEALKILPFGCGDSEFQCLIQGRCAMKAAVHEAAALGMFSWFHPVFKLG